MKKTLYIFLFVVLGVMVSFLAHAALELAALWLLIRDFDTYGLGLSWAQWEIVHYIGGAILLLLGIIFGFQQGKHWWQVIYIEKRYFWRKWHWARNI